MFRRSYPTPPRIALLSQLSVLFSSLLLVRAALPICEPGFLGSGSYEFSDEQSNGLDVILDCTQLSEPKVGATVIGPFREIIENTDPSSYSLNIGFYYGYSCVGENISIARNTSTNLPRGTFGRWTRRPGSVEGAQPLPLGTTCSLTGCYVYTLTNSSYTKHYVFSINSTSCVIDRDECWDGTAGCEQDCTDIRNGSSDSYECSCRTGYILSNDSHNCTDVDECSVGSNNCDQICTTHPSSAWFNCSCVDGFYLDDDGHTCNDINECEERNGTELCETETTGQECNNTQGGYLCLCPKGYELNNITKTCTDIDECKPDMPQVCQNICTNTPGGYSCRCSTWYHLVGLDKCEAIDVCKENEYYIICGAHSTCVNSPDTEYGYTCECDSGYSRSGNSCYITGLVHIVWITTFLLLAVLVSIFIFILIQRYVKNRRDSLLHGTVSAKLNRTLWKSKDRMETEQLADSCKVKNSDLS